MPKSQQKKVCGEEGLLEGLKAYFMPPTEHTEDIL